MKELLARLAPTIRLWGFKGSGQNYRLVNEHSVAVINFQKSSGGDRFYINLGVQPLRIPTDGDQQPEAKTLKEYECVFRRRVDAPQKLEGWSYSLSESELNDLLARLKDSYNEFVVPLIQYPGLATRLTLKEFLDQKPLSFGTSARQCLHFVRLQLAYGEEKSAREFVEYGIKTCPAAATGLLNDLLELKKKCGG